MHKDTTHQEVSNETYKEDKGKDEKSHSKGYSQDCCPAKKVEYLNFETKFNLFHQTKLSPSSK